MRPAILFAYSLIPLCLQCAPPGSLNAQIRNRAADDAGGPNLKNSLLKTVSGDIVEVNRRDCMLTIKGEEDEYFKLRLDDKLTLVFSGIRPLEVADLEPGDRALIDFLENTTTGISTVTWVELTKKGTR
jgi:hypothetical protein